MRSGGVASRVIARRPSGRRSDPARLDRHAPLRGLAMTVLGPLRKRIRDITGYTLAPSKGVIATASRSMSSTQRRLTATIALPSGPVPPPQGAQPQVRQHWGRILWAPKV